MRTVATIAVVLALGGCSAALLGGYDPSLAMDSHGYRQVLGRWTKHLKVYRHFEAKIFATATYLSPEFREAWIRRETRLLGLPAGDVRLLEARHAERDRRYHEFVVAVYTAERRWNDLDSDGSMWRIKLANDRNQEVSPSQVERQDLRRGDLRSYFPYIGVFHHAYLVRFPKMILELNAPIIDQGVHAFSLRLLSGIAVAKLEWSLADLGPTGPRG